MPRANARAGSIPAAATKLFSLQSENFPSGPDEILRSRNCASKLFRIVSERDRACISPYANVLKDKLLDVVLASWNTIIESRRCASSHDPIGS